MDLRNRKRTRSSEGSIHGGRLAYNIFAGGTTWVNLRFQEKPATEWTFERAQRRVQAPPVYAFTMKDMLAVLHLSELLAITLAVAQAERTDP